MPHGIIGSTFVPNERRAVEPVRPFSLVIVAILGIVLLGCGATAESSYAASDHASHTAATQSPPGTSGASPDEGPPADATRLDDGATIVISQFEFSETAVIVPAGAT